MRYLIGVDDTDSSKRPGTGALVRRLAEWLQADRLAQPHGVTRHQLASNKHIPYTGRNSAVCLVFEAENREGVWETARDFLALEAAPHANAGLAMIRWDGVGREVIELGKRAKEQVLTLDEAHQAASRSRVRHAAVKGNGNGVIGAIAAVGLRRSGNDGRFMWLPGLFELQGLYLVGELLDRTAIDRVCSVDGTEIPTTAVVDVGDWPRPILREGQVTLLVEGKKDSWHVLDKERVKDLSN